MRAIALLLLLSASAWAAEPLAPPNASGRPTVVYFVLRDCPISNQFAPEMNRICSEYEKRGVDCFLAYTDPDLTPESLAEHRADFSHRIPAVHDAEHAWVALAGATITPEAALFDAQGKLAYRGRVNNLYAALGKARRQATRHDLRDALDAVLAGKPVATPRTEAIGCYIPDLDAIRSSR